MTSNEPHTYIVAREGSFVTGRVRAAVAALVAAAAILSGVLTYSLTREPAGAVSETPEVTTLAEPSDGGLSSSEMLERVLPSVVNVRATSVVRDPFGGAREQTASGSGTILSEDGIILTNNHVTAGAASVSVEFTDGRETLPATVLGASPEHDLAVLDVDASGLSALPVGDSSALRLGDHVFAIGFPLDLGPTVTQGIVSGTGRDIELQNERGVVRLEDMLQTDAAINPGNSGGALVDEEGRLVGIPTAAAQASSAENVGFAISIDAAKDIVGGFTADLAV